MQCCSLSNAKNMQLKNTVRKDNNHLITMNNSNLITIYEFKKVGIYGTSSNCRI